MTPQEKLEQYSKEIAEDLKLNEMVIQQKSFEIPQRKHYWVTKLILETQELNRLERKKKALEKTALEKQEPLVQMSTASMKMLLPIPSLCRKLLKRSKIKRCWLNI